MPDAPVHPAIQRVLDAAARKGVTLEVSSFDESTHTAAEAAAALGAELGQIVKSLVFVVPAATGREPVLCLVAGHNRVDLARLAAVTGAPDIRRATAREAHDLTGFSIGGIPPIGHGAGRSGDHGSRISDATPSSGPQPACRPRSSRPAGHAAHPVERDGRPDRRGGARPTEPSSGRRLRRRPARRAADRAARRASDRRTTATRTITYPGGLRARWRWGGSGSGPAVFALSEAGGALVDLGTVVAADPEPLCRAELRLEGPRGAWTARFASLIHDEPRALHWDTAGLLVVAYGFHTYGLDVDVGRAALGPSVGDAAHRAARVAAARARHRPVRARDVRDRARRDGRLAGRPFRRRHRRRARRRPARPDRASTARSARSIPHGPLRRLTAAGCGQTVDNPADLRPKSVDDPD